jgi:ketosteroid isomerase-like protein
MGETATTDARAVARSLIAAFNARDLDALRELVAEDAELRTLRGDALRGHEGLQAIVRTAEELDIRLVPVRDETVEEREGGARVAVPVRELIGPDDIERTLELELRGGRVSVFAVRPFAG